jgi:hypothetical protein
MFSYYNLVVSNAQAERSQLAGYRVSPGAKAEITSEAIAREIGHGGTSRFSRPTYRLALLLAASVVLAIAGIQGASAQGQPGMFADVDGIEPPDMGVAYTLPVRSNVASVDMTPTNQDAGLTADADGIEPPDSGIAYNTSAAFVAFAKRQQQIRTTETVADADGIEPPDMGVAYDTSAAHKAYAERQKRTNRIAVRADGRK